MIRTGKMLVLGALCALVPLVPTQARSLDTIRMRGAIEQCVHPNALPYSNRKGDPQGFQIELGEAIAKQLGVALEPVWIIGGHQVRRSGCDIVTDAIAQPEIQDESGLKVSKPYYRTGIVLVVRADSPIVSAETIDRGGKVGVMGSSVASMVLSKRGVNTSAFAFEDDMLAAIADKEIDGAVVSRAAAGYFNVAHPGEVRIVDIDALAPEFSWNVAVGMSKPDDKLRTAINSALDQLSADGTIQRIYAKYGMNLQPPQ